MGSYLISEVHISRLVILIGVSVGCEERYFIKSSMCVRCPEHCRFCESESKCFTCDDGYAGNVCQNYCSQCIPGTRCDKADTYCYDGCKDGFSGRYCNETCSPICVRCSRKNATECVNSADCLLGYWGSNCEQRCPIDCADECNKESGECSDENQGSHNGNQSKLCLISLAIIPVVVIAILIHRKSINRKLRKHQYNMANKTTTMTEVPDKDLLSNTRSGSKRAETYTGYLTPVRYYTAVDEVTTNYLTPVSATRDEHHVDSSVPVRHVATVAELHTEYLRPVTSTVTADKLHLHTNYLTPVSAIRDDLHVDSSIPVSQVASVEKLHTDYLRPDTSTVTADKLQLPNKTVVASTVPIERPSEQYIDLDEVSTAKTIDVHGFALQNTSGQTVREC